MRDRGVRDLDGDGIDRAIHDDVHTHGVKRIERRVDARVTTALDVLAAKPVPGVVAFERGHQVKAVRGIDCSGRNTSEPAERAGNADAHRSILALEELT